jgi:GNAT superfamily N-acetyltransferase
VESARPATAGDAARIAELWARGRDEIAGAKGGALFLVREATAVPPVPPLRGRGLVVVGCIDEVVVGYAAVNVQPLRDGSSLAVLTDLYVEPEAREVSVGEEMMNVVLRWCEAEGCRGIDAIALPGDRATKNFFERHGLVARAIVVHRPLGADTTEEP